MTQRVNIQYSVDLDNLDSEIQRLLQEALYVLKEVGDNTNTPSNTLTLEAYDQIDNIRRSLAKVDVRLGEVNSLINAYLTFKTQEAMQSPNATTPVPPESSHLDALDKLGHNFSDIQERIDKFKQDLDTQDSYNDHSPQRHE